MVSTLMAALLAAVAVYSAPPAIVLAGQSNALYSAPAVASHEAPLAVLNAAHPGQPISQWASSRPYWADLAALVAHRRLQAFVWWQGESDRANPDYAGDLRDLLARVRAANGNPRLRVVLVLVLDLPENAGVRAAQRAVAAGDPDVRLVSSDCGQRLGASDHLTPAGYEVVARRIALAAWHWR